MRVRRFDEQAKAFGDIIHVTQFPTMTIAAVGSDGTMTNQTTTPTQVNLTIDQWRGNSISILNRAAKQANIDSIKAYAEAMKGIIVQDVENALLDVTSSMTGTAAGDGLSHLNEDLLAAAVGNALTAELGDHLEDSERMSWFLATTEWAPLHTAGFVKEYNITGQPGGAAMPVQKERSIWGIPAFFSTRVQDTTYAGNNIYNNVLAAKEAFSLAVQKEVGITQLYTTGLVKAYAADVLYGVSASIAARGFIVRSVR